jgi:hypothetical protein
MSANSNNTRVSISTSAKLVWCLNCIYDETWRVAVVYLTIQNAHAGMPCTREMVLDATVIGTRRDSSLHMATNNSRQQQDDTDNTWTEISMDEHPIAGTPSYFVHPYRTAKRLGSLFGPK